MLRILPFIFFLIPLGMLAQPLPYDTLNVNQFHLSMDAGGGLGYHNLHPSSSPEWTKVSFVPEDEGTSALFGSLLWMGATIGSDTICEGSLFRYDQVSWMPGPIMSSPSYYAQDSSKWNQVWKLSAAEISYHQLHYSDAGYSPIEAIENWPAHGDTTLGQAYELAPYQDVNNDGMYNPLDGDYPLIRGDQAVLAIFNDERVANSMNYPAHMAATMQVEVHLMLYGFDCDEDETIDQSLFLHYDVFNRGEQDLENVYVGQWADFDLGNPQDDYVACDVGRNMFYVYNGDSVDENSYPLKGYGTNLGTMGIKFLNGAPIDSDGLDNMTGNEVGERTNGFGFNDGIIDNERMGIESFTYFINGSSGTYDKPQIPDDFYHLLAGHWKGGVPKGYGYHGIFSISEITAKYMYPGNSDNNLYGTYGVNPVDSGLNPNWTERTDQNSPGDRRGIGSMGPFTLKAQENFNLDMALVFARAPYGQDSLALMNAADHIQAAYDQQNFTCGNFWPLQVDEKEGTAQWSLSPNPSNGWVKITGESAPQVVEVYNLQGGLIMEVNAENRSLDLSSLGSGIYFIRSGQTVQKLVIQ